MPTCKLCHEERDLCDSHVMPEFLYRQAYDDLNSAFAIDRRKMHGKFIQKGLFEKLLCQDCEQNRLNRPFENYFEKLWYGSSPLPSHVPEPQVHLTNLDYARFKLFHLSILWRSDVARTFAFQQTELGSFGEDLRQMLLSGDPRGELEFPVMGTILTSRAEKAVTHDMLMPPTARRFEGMRMYSSVYAGCAWHVIVSRKPPPTKCYPDVLKTDGSLLLGVGDFVDFSPAVNFVGSYVQTARKKGHSLDPWKKRRGL